MNENLNLVEILKDCPKGTKLYSPLFGEVEFEQILENWGYVSVRKGKDTWPFESDARFPISDSKSAELMLYPSKDQRDWSKFKLKKERFVHPCEFEDGDILSYQCKGFNSRSIYIYRYHKRFNTSYYVALSGDDNEFRIDNTGKWALNGYNDTVRFATEDEKKKLFQAIKDNGYKWNAKTKILEKLVKPKFDPKTLKPFDKILVRDRVIGRCSHWMCTFFSYYDERKFPYPCRCAFAPFGVCIPYNDETKHLVGTDDEAPEYYRYWKD